MKYRYKIDVHGGFRKYAVYKKWMGVWWAVYKTDSISKAEEFVLEALGLPMYYG